MDADILPDLPNPIELAIPAFVALILLEMIYGRLTGRVRYEPRDTATSLIMGLGNQVATALTSGAIIAFGLWVWDNFRLLDIPFTWRGFVLAFVGEDLAYYWVHRCGHRLRWLWAAHVIHHSSQHYNLSTALRQTWTSVLAVNFLFRVPLFLIGFHPLLIAFVAALNLIYQFWIHTEAVRRMPRWFEAVFNTPSHHRVHHAINPRYLDANYAGVFIIWDKLFGTFVPEDDAEPCRYGIVKQLGTFNPLKVAFHEWIGMIRDMARARSLKEALLIPFKPPGWRLDGGETTDVIKARWAARRRAAAADPSTARRPAEAMASE